jgi:hypothetical protein
VLLNFRATTGARLKQRANTLFRGSQMGLDIYAANDGGHVLGIPYRGFHLFRQALIETIDPQLVLKECVGYGGTKSLPNHPLSILFDHSDCDGELSPEDCMRLWPILLASSSAMPDKYWADVAIRLGEAFKDCAQKGVGVEFR